MPSLPEDLRFSDLTHPNVHPSDPRLLAQGKRIKGPNAKYYVIWRGRRTGIFGNWALARALVRGYPQAAFAGYQSEADARRAFVEGPTSEELHLVNRPGSFDEFEDDQIEPGDIAFCNRIVSISLFSPRPTGRRVPHPHSSTYSCIPPPPFPSSTQRISRLFEAQSKYNSDSSDKEFRQRDVRDQGTYMFENTPAYVIVRGLLPGVYVDQLTAFAMLGTSKHSRLHIAKSVPDADHYFVRKFMEGMVREFNGKN